MASRSTRNKVQFQAKSASDDLRHAMGHLVGMAALADDRSAYIDEYLPSIVAGLELLIDSYEVFREGL